PGGSAGGRLRGGEPEVSGAPLPRRAGAQAGRVRDEPARRDRPALEPGWDPVRLRPPARGREARRGRRERPDRVVHAADPRHARDYERRPAQRGQRGDRREGDRREGRARGGGRWLRVRDRREGGCVEGPDAWTAGLGPAPDPVRDRRRLRDEPRRCGARLRLASALEARPDAPRARRLRPAEAEVRKALSLAAGLALAAAVLFLALPVAALFLRVPAGDLLHAARSGVFRDALLVSLKTSAIA